MKKFILLIAVMVLIASGALLAACSDDDDDKSVSPSVTEGAGTLEFYANGEDFVRQGFVSKDGWSITFDNVYITLTDIMAYQADPPYDAHTGGAIAGDGASLSGMFTVDLAEGDENASPILVGQLTDVASGRYNAISWQMAQALEGASAGHSLVMIGTAEKEGQIEDFAITLDAICSYTCGDYVGDDRKGSVAAGGVADLEMTFHFDHLFGDNELAADDDLNLGALGFEALLAMPEGGDPNMDMAELHLGHVGEGHCDCECQ